jgi:hypothetical protein
LAFILTYSIEPNAIHPAPITDAPCWAMKMIRDNAKKFRIDPDKVGIADFPRAGISPLRWRYSGTARTCRAGGC